MIFEYESYFDDSSDEKRSEYCACGGLIAGPDQWDIFWGLWSQATSVLREPFHATDCECGYGQFKNWEKSERDALMAQLVSILLKARLMGFGCVVPVPFYRKAFPDSGEFDPYFLALRQVMMNVAYIAADGGRDVKVWFESGSNDAEALRIYGAISRFSLWPPSKKIQAVTFNTKTLYPLQAADLVAREAFKHVQNRGQRRTRVPVRRMQNNLCFMEWSQESLYYLAANGGPDNLALLAEWDSRVAPKLTHFWSGPRQSQ